MNPDEYYEPSAYDPAGDDEHDDSFMDRLPDEDNEEDEP